MVKRVVIPVEHGREITARPQVDRGADAAQWQLPLHITRILFRGTDISRSEGYEWSTTREAMRHGDRIEHRAHNPPLLVPAALVGHNHSIAPLTRIAADHRFRRRSRQSNWRLTSAAS